MFRQECLSGWSLASHADCYVARVGSRGEIERALEQARRRALSVAVRGGGYSYGDEILNRGGVVLDCSPMARILDWNPVTGLMTVEPGVTYAQALEVCLRDNWVIPAVPGTRYPTLGGSLANNVHGKNAWRDGNLGDWIESFELLAGNGRVYRCSRTENRDLFFAAVGGLGLLGVFLEIVARCKRVPSPYLEVRKWTVPDLETMLRDFEGVRSTTDYHIGWVDCFHRGHRLGRGTIHVASFIDPGAGIRNGRGLDYRSRYVLGIVPRSWIWPAVKPFFGNALMRLVNAAKYHVDRITSRRGPYIQNFFEFTFLLDTIPNWRRLFTPYGYLELEPVVPFEACAEVLPKLVELTQRFGRPSHLTAVKSHRADESVLSYSVDGCSIGIDIPLRPGGREEVRGLFDRLNEVVLGVGGRVYLAKDEMLTPAHFRKMFPRWQEMVEIKRRYDPELLFQSDMYRRLFIDSDALSKLCEASAR